MTALNMPRRPTSSNKIATRLVVSIPEQKMELWEDGILREVFVVSTSKFGEGMEPDSFRTPTGRFEVCAKIGAGAAPGAVFRGRMETGEIAAQGGEEDRVLTRILWLDGVDPANANTKDRYIYIHGTNREDRLGTKASHGCVRMRNADIIALFDRIEPGAGVEIIV